MVQLTISDIGSDNGWAPNRRQAITRTNAYSVYWCIYAALGADILQLTVNQMGKKKYSLPRLCLQKDTVIW